MSARIVYYPNSTISGDDDLYGGGDDSISQTANLPWVVVWICALLLFGCTPFCISKKRRQLCRRRIRERRWIVEPDWYDSLLQRQRQRREEMSRQHQEFQISRTQEDEIREQFLLAQLEKYTITLTKNDIHESIPAVSQKCLSEQILSEHCLKEKDAMIISKSDSGETAVSSSDIEAPPPVGDVAGNHSTREDDDDDNDEKDEILVGAFEDLNGTIDVPLAGVENDDGKTTRRQVPNGCVICLSGFDPDEKITWSYNPLCSHIFHHECVVHWYLTVGRKEQRKCRRRHPLLGPEEELAMICKFPMDCPCCRRSFCKPVDDDNDDGKKHAKSSLSPDNSGTIEIEAPIAEPAANASHEQQPEETPPIIDDSSSSPASSTPLADATIDTSSPSSSLQSITTPAPDTQEEDPEQPSTTL